VPKNGVRIYARVPHNNMIERTGSEQPAAHHDRSTAVVNYQHGRSDIQQLMTFPLGRPADGLDVFLTC